MNGTTTPCVKELCITLQVNLTPTTSPCQFPMVINAVQSGSTAQYVFNTNIPQASASDSIRWMIQGHYYYANQAAHTFTEAGTFPVCLVIWRSNAQGVVQCVKDTCIQLQVAYSTQPNCDFAANFTFYTDSLGSPNTVHFINTTPVEVDSVTWIFGDGTAHVSGNTATHTFTQANNQVCLRLVKLLPNGQTCVKEVCKPVLVSMEEYCPASVYPNPANNLLNANIMLPASTDIIIRIMNGNGAIVLQAVHTGVQGSNQVSINVSNLLPGLYTVTYQYNGHQCSQQFIKQ